MRISKVPEKGKGNVSASSIKRSELPKILLVDDEPDIILTLRNGLEDTGFSVVSCFVSINPYLNPQKRSGIMDNIIIIEIPIVSSLNVLIYFCMSCSYQHRRNLASLSVIGTHFGSGNLNI